MENCTIYSHELKFDQILSIIKENLPKAQIEIEDGGLQKSMIATIKGGFFSKTKTLKINYRERANPSYKLEEIECGLTQNLAGMANFIQSLPAQNEVVRGQLLHKVMSMNCEIAFMAEPTLIADFQKFLKAITFALDAIIFTPPNSFFAKSTGQHFLDKNLNLILDNNGNCEIDNLVVNVNAKYHDIPTANYVEEQLERKSKSEAILSKNEVKVNKNIPCIATEAATNLRTKEAIIQRVYALLIIAVKGEGVEQEKLNQVIKDKNITSFSAKETMILKKENLEDGERAYATWRYESLTVLLWALGKIDQLKYPAEICNVPEIVNAIFRPNRKEFEDSAKLRSKAEILDQLDKIYRMHWACVDARIKGEEVKGGLLSGVVYERHNALNWLTNYQGADWDDVQTNT